MNVEELSRNFADYNAVVTAAIEKAGAKSASLEDKVSGVEQTLAGVKDTVATLQQKGIRSGSGLGLEVKSVGEMFASSEELQRFRQVRSHPTRCRVELPLSTKTVTSASGSGGDTIVPARGAIEMMARPPLRIVDLLPTIAVQTGSIEFAKQSNRALNPSTVAEGQLKPESDIAFTLVTVPVRTIATWVACSRQVLDDQEQLRGLIDTELLFAIRQKEEQEVLAGDGTGTHVLGLIPSSTAFVAPISVPTPTSIDIIGTAILQVALANFTPNAIVLHPSDLARIRLLKDSEGRYLVSDNPATGMPPTLFGIGLVPSLGISPDKFLVLDTTAAATVYRRMNPIVEASTEDRDNFIRNMVTLLSESRLALAIRWAGAGAAVYGDFGVLP